jgi:hypothetical protein
VHCLTLTLAPVVPLAAFGQTYTINSVATSQKRTWRAFRVHLYGSGVYSANHDARVGITLLKSGS